MAEFYDGPHATPPPAPEGPVFLGVRNLTEGGRLDLSDIRHIAESDYAAWTRRVEPAPGDVVFTYEASLHRYAVIPAGFRGVLGRRVALLRPRPEVVDTRFLLYSFTGPEWRETVQQRLNAGSTVDRLPLTEFPQFPLAVPPLAIQRKIAAVLSAYDDLIENNNRRIKILEEMAQRIYREWFIDFRYPGHEGVPLVDSELGPIPDGWGVVPLSTIASIGKGLSYKGAFLTEAGVPMVNLKCFDPGGGFRRSGTKPYSGPFQSRHEVQPGSLVVANTDLTQAGHVIGSVATVPRKGFEGGGLISHHLFAIRPDNVRAQIYLRHALSDARFRQFARSRASGTTVLGFQTRDCEQYPVLVPPDRLISAFEDIAVCIDGGMETLTDTSELLTDARDLLLPRLVSGEIDVTDLDIATPEAA